MSWPFRLCPWRIACAAKNAISVDGSASTSVTTPNTPALAQSTGSRLGTAANVERIMPVEYSPLITSTPSTPIASWAMVTPIRLVSSGWKPALSAALMLLQRLALTSAGTTAKPMVITTPASSE